MNNAQAAKTLAQYDAAILGCRSLFMLKMQDYGPSWRLLRPSSVTDQLLIKARRIRSIQEKGKQMVQDPLTDDFIGLVNYALMGCVQLDLGASLDAGGSNEAAKSYEEAATKARKLMQAKNHDYGEAWRDMRIASLVDLILVKLERIKQIEDNAGETLISEGIEAGYLDICNYALFALIKLQEHEKASIEVTEG